MRYIPLILALALTLPACKKDKATTKVDKEGLTKEIRNLVPQHVLDQMKQLGMPINGGETPPLLVKGNQATATFLAKPFRLKSSNRPGDVPNYQFADYEVTFRQQDNDNLTIKVDYLNGPESGNGLGSYIVGDDCKFSVFVEINATNSGTFAKIIHVISGTLLSDGIENLYFANFMVDNNGNAAGVWIENGQGRVIYDTDGFSELKGITKNWNTALPACPCTYAEAKSIGETLCPAGRWSNCGSANQDYHYGAAFEVRWLPSTAAQPGQQCTYDAAGNLITGGIAAGSPDKVSPGACGFWSWLVSGTGTIPAFTGHRSSDIDPWKTIPCWQYLRDWPANNRLACITNKVSDIDHMRLMIGNMTCEEATLLIRKAKESPAALIDAQLREYILGSGIALSNAQLKSKLQAWKNQNACMVFPTDAICKVIDKAIANLP